MKDVVAIVSITFFWFILAIILTSVQNDPGLAESQAAFENIDTTIGEIDLNTTNTLISSSTVSGNTTITEAETRVPSISFVSMFFRMLTFQIPTPDGTPNALIGIIEVFNFMLVAVFGLLLYRQIRHGGG